MNLKYPLSLCNIKKVMGGRTQFLPKVGTPVCCTTGFPGETQNENHVSTYIPWCCWDHNLIRMKSNSPYSKSVQNRFGTKVQDKITRIQWAWTSFPSVITANDHINCDHIDSGFLSSTDSPLILTLRGVYVIAISMLHSGKKSWRTYILKGNATRRSHNGRIGAAIS